MKAVVRTTYGSLEVADVDMPAVPDDGVLVRVRAAGLNASDWYAMMGRPYFGRLQMGLVKPKSDRLGTDFAGTVEAVGKDVTQFRPGDEVFGGRSGALAEYLCVPAGKAIAAKPANIAFDQAAAVGVAGLTALQGLRDRGKVQPGQKVLVNGASGGVGTFAVQVAKALGAGVTAVCSTRNVEQARRLGADRVIDYTQEDFTQSGERYDVVFDVAGSKAWPAYARVLKPGGTLVLVGGPKGGRLLGPLSRILRVKLASIGNSRKAVFFIAQFTKEDMEALGGLFESGKVTPVVSDRFELDEAAGAFRAMGEGHARGKIVVALP
jgi:NADPH:quinone reductase-like Zn-dependent oxidoreductase